MRREHLNRSVSSGLLHSQVVKQTILAEISKMNTFVAVFSMLALASAPCLAAPEGVPAVAVDVAPAGVVPVDQAVADTSVHYAYGREYG